MALWLLLWDSRIHIHFIDHCLNIGCHISWWADVVVFLLPRYQGLRNPDSLDSLSLVLNFSRICSCPFSSRTAFASFFRVSGFPSWFLQRQLLLFDLLIKVTTRPIDCCFWLNRLNRFVLHWSHLGTPFTAFWLAFTNRCFCNGFNSSGLVFFQTSQENLSFHARHNRNMPSHEEYLKSFRPFESLLQQLLWSGARKRTKTLAVL